MITKYAFIASFLLAGVSSQCPEVLSGSCAICGSADLCVTKKDAGFAFPGQPRVECTFLEIVGLAGAIPQDQCELLPDIISEICGCGTLISDDTDDSSTNNTSNENTTNEDTDENIKLSRVKTDKLVYEIGEPLSVTFTIEEPRTGDWIGIFPNGRDLSDLGSALYWIWVCNRVGLNPCGPEATGTVSFNDSKQVGWGNRDFWDPEEGEYLAITIRNGNDRPWEVIDVSPVFRYVLTRDGLELPTDEQSQTPSISPSFFPSTMPTMLSSDNPSQLPSQSPSLFPSVLPTATPSEFTVQRSSARSNKGNYEVGEAITITFQIKSPQMGDWLGIFPAFLDIRNLPDPLYWIWVCDRVGERSCGPQPTGKVTFDNSKQVAWNQRNPWPPAPGMYQAMTLRDGTGSPWEAISVSSSFTIV